MLLLFLCPGTIPVPSCRPSCQMSCCEPPSSGCAAVASSRLSTAYRTAPTQSCSVDPGASPSGSGRGTRSSSSAASSPAQKRMSCLAVCETAAEHRASAKQSRRHPVFRPAGFFTLLFWGAAKRQFRNRFSGRVPVFCTPWTGGTTSAAVPVPSAVAATEIGPLTSSPAGQHQSSGGALWRPVYAPGWWSNQLSLYPSTLVHSVQSLYISCYVLSNKLVLSYLLPQENKILVVFYWNSDYAKFCQNLARKNYLIMSEIPPRKII